MKKIIQTLLYLMWCANKEKGEQKEKAVLAPCRHNSTSISWLKLLLALTGRIHKGREGNQWIRQLVHPGPASCWSPKGPDNPLTELWAIAVSGETSSFHENSLLSLWQPLTPNKMLLGTVCEGYVCLGMISLKYSILSSVGVSDKKAAF